MKINRAFFSNVARFFEEHKVVEVLLTITGLALSVVAAVGGVVKPIPRLLIMIFGIANLLIGFCLWAVKQLNAFGSSSLSTQYTSPTPQRQNSFTIHDLNTRLRSNASFTGTSRSTTLPNVRFSEISQSGSASFIPQPEVASPMGSRLSMDIADSQSSLLYGSSLSMAGLSESERARSLAVQSMPTLGTFKEEPSQMDAADDQEGSSRDDLPSPSEIPSIPRGGSFFTSASDIHISGGGGFYSISGDMNQTLSQNDRTFQSASVTTEVPGQRKPFASQDD